LNLAWRWTKVGVWSKRSVHRFFGIACASAGCDGHFSGVGGHFQQRNVSQVRFVREHFEAGVL
jgi:hypothetical protein